MSKEINEPSVMRLTAPTRHEILKTQNESKILRRKKMLAYVQILWCRHSKHEIFALVRNYYNQSRQVPDLHST
jgi:hypothetical protein